METICKICGNSHNNIKYYPKEMMFGFKEEFEYFMCSKCGCLQRRGVLNLEKYYPDNYYSLSQKREYKIKTVLKRINDLRYKNLCGNKSVLGMALNRVYPIPVHEKEQYLLFKEIPFNADILDVGTGNGGRLEKLHRIGFENLVGVDRYIDSDIYTYPNIIPVKKSDFVKWDTNQKFDVIMFHHSFEHIDNPQDTLAKVKCLLKENGMCIIRIPISSCYAWRKYRENWAQIDAPRHSYLFSVKSMDILAKQEGFYIKQVVYDSAGWALACSENYCKGIPMNQQKRLSAMERKKYDKMAMKLNRERAGDQAIFVFEALDKG